MIRNRQALLDANPAIRTCYLAAGDPLNVYGLPVSRVEDMGNHYALRTQRAVFQKWKEAVPWASAGQVTIANGGDIGKELGWLGGEAIHPEHSPVGYIPRTTWATENLFVMAEGASSLLAMQTLLNGGEQPEQRILGSRDGGRTWVLAASNWATLPRDCGVAFSFDYNLPNGFLAYNCHGLFRWDGGAGSSSGTSQPGPRRGATGHPASSGRYVVAVVSIAP